MCGSVLVDGEISDDGSEILGILAKAMYGRV